MYRHPSLIHFVRSVGTETEEIDLPEFQTCLSSFVSKLDIINNGRKSIDGLGEEVGEIRFLKDGLFDFSDFVFKDDSFDWLSYISENFASIDKVFSSCSFTKIYSEPLKVLAIEKLDSYAKTLYFRHVNGSLFDSYCVCSILTSIIERVLVSVLVNHFKVKLEENPTLSNVLVNPAMEEFLGKWFKSFLIATVGSPLGLNIRNIIFHGFISCKHEFSRPCTSLVFIITMTLLSRVKEKKIELEWYWKKLSTSESLKELETVHFSKEEVLELCKRSLFVIHDRRDVVSHAIECFYSGHHYDFCVLLIPQIEHFLRRIFIVSNRKEERYFLAQRKELFTTMDVLLNFTQKQKQKGEEEEKEKEKEKEKGGYEKNLIYKLLGNNLYQLLLDVFVRDSGLRIRDTFAHFQQPPSALAITTVSARFSKVLMNVFVHLLAKFTRNLPDSFEKSPFISKYISVFNPISTLLEQFREAVVRLDQFEHTVVGGDDEQDSFLRRVKEVSNYECRWNKKCFFYSKKKSPIQGKLKVFKVEDICKAVEAREKEYTLCEYFWDKEKDILREFYAENGNKLENLDVSIDQRRQMMNNVGMCIKIVSDVRELMTLFTTRLQQLKVMIQERKARTAQRKSFGVLVKTAPLFKRILKLLLIRIHLRIKEDMMKYEDLLKNHDFLCFVYGNGIHKMLSLALEGKFGMSIHEYFFSFDNVQRS